MAPSFDHERLDVYRQAIEFVAWAGTLIDGALRRARLSAVTHLDEAATSIALNIAEGNGKRSLVDRARFLDIARGSALESGACLDVLLARGRLDAEAVEAGKARLVRIVSMLTKFIDSLLTRAASAA